MGAVDFAAPRLSYGRRALAELMPDEPEVHGLLRRLGRAAEARDAYRRALSLVHDDAERRLLERRLAQLGPVMCG